jgi:anthranilate phosphoribosyltransferase
MIRPVVNVMKEIGYESAIVLHGTIDDSDQGMDEASVCGITHCASIFKGEIHEFTIDPKKLGLAVKNCHDLAPEKDIETESKRFAALLNNRDSSARKDAALLNAGLIFLAAGKATALDDGIEQAATLLEAGTAFEALERWVKAQNTDPEKGLSRLDSLVS